MNRQPIVDIPAARLAMSSRHEGTHRVSYSMQSIPSRLLQCVHEKAIMR